MVVKLIVYITVVVGVAQVFGVVERVSDERVEKGVVLVMLM